MSRAQPLEVAHRFAQHEGFRVSRARPFEAGCTAVRGSTEFCR